LEQADLEVDRAPVLRCSGAWVPVPGF